MTENLDILRLIGGKKTKDQFLVGFAAETDDLEKNALLKMQKKKALKRSWLTSAIK